METKLLQLAMNNLLDEIEKIKEKLAHALSEIETLKNEKGKTPEKEIQKKNEVDLDTLLDIKEVKSILGICYNSLNKLVKSGILKPIRINQRRIRFTKRSIVAYIQSIS